MPMLVPFLHCLPDEQVGPLQCFSALLRRMDAVLWNTATGDKTSTYVGKFIALIRCGV